MVYGTNENNNSNSLPLRLCFFFQTQDVALENVTAESATVRPKNKYFKTINYAHFEVFAYRMDSQASSGHVPTKCTFQPRKQCVIHGLLPFTNYSIHLRVCDRSSSCSGYKAGEGFRTLHHCESFFSVKYYQNEFVTHGHQHVGP